jgi:hypothetical protein
MSRARGPADAVREWVLRFNPFDQLSFFRLQGLAVPETYLGPRSSE